MRRHLSFALLVALGCRSSAEPVAAPAEPEPFAVGVAQVELARISEPIPATGSVLADKTTEIGPRVDGIVEQIAVRVGDRVAEGQPLFRTRSVDYRLRLAEAEAAMLLVGAEAEKAARDRERVRTLHEKGVASRERLEQAETGLEVTRARVATAHAAVAMARQALADCVVRAPYAGVVTRRYIDEGAMLRTMMGGGSAVVQLMKTDAVFVIAQVPETQLPRVRVGTPTRIRIDGLDRVFESRVEVLNDRVEATSRSLEVRMPVANPDLAIKPGLSATAEILPEPREALVLDRRALLGAADSRFVFVADGGRAVRRSVEVRDLDAARVEVLRGLVRGDRALVGPDLARLADGSLVRIEVADVAR
jgi:RND family efflux transporter MFP subunit